ncbi:hypothetical protein DYU05_20075 [Mucilaginibacter terrenus]|uniref:Uncharacterized protein n=1 Tax=Mucilaginibacter terrenus TaxID=2482727 RepID=A0A3E2NJV5_9SPHI|nr:hypothetical protein [Mucilaginibacter terrenus]RFZ81282.1 hypothetical protein DYU05_20075 [Mucilaginibacter terrenus]
MILKRPWALFYILLACLSLAFQLLGYLAFNVFTAALASVAAALAANQSLVLFVQGLASFILIMGLCRVLRNAAEPLWIRLIVIAIIALRITLPVVYVLTVQHFFAVPGGMQSMFILGILTNTCMYAAFFFVRNKPIRRYYRAFAVLGTLTLLLPYAGPYAAENFSIHWLPQTADVPGLLTNIPLILLFLRLYTSPIPAPLHPTTPTGISPPYSPGTAYTAKPPPQAPTPAQAIADTPS